MKKLFKITAFLLLIMLIMTGCASTGRATGTPPEPEEKSTLVLPVALSEEEFSYHGVHIRIPDIFEMKSTEDHPERFQSEWRNSDEVDKALQEVFDKNPGYVFHHPLMRFEMGYSGVNFWQKPKDGDYSPYSARSSFAELVPADIEGMEATEERTRLNGVDVLIQKYNSVAKTSTTLYVILNSCVVQISCDSYSEQFDELFAESINSIRVDENEIPELVKQTDPENLTAAGLNTRAWQFNDLYLHVPASYIAVEMTSGYINWLSNDGSAYIYLQETDASAVKAEQDDWGRTLSGMTGFQEIGECRAGIYNGMQYSSASYLFLDNNGSPCQGEMIVLLPDQKEGKAVMVAAACPVGDTENQALIDSTMNTVHVADGWIGEGLLTPEAITMEEFEAMPE